MSSESEEEANGPERKGDPFDDVFAPVWKCAGVAKEVPGDEYQTQVYGTGEDVVSYEAEGEVGEGFEFWGCEDVGGLFEGRGGEDEI